MGDLHRDPGEPPDVQRFFDGGDQLVVFVAHVRRVRQSGPPEGSRQGGQFLEVGKPPGDVLEPGRDAAGAGRERRFGTAPHLVHLLGRGGPVLVADHEVANGSVAHHARQVDCRPLPLQPREESSQIADSELEPVPFSIALSHPGGGLGIPRADRAAVLAGDLGRDPLADLAFGERAHEEIEIRVRMDVDEAGRHRQSLYRDLDGGRSADPSRDLGDAVARDQDVRLDGRCAGAIEHEAVPKHHVGKWTAATAGAT